MVTKVDLDKFSEEERREGVEVLSKEETAAMPVTVFYWDQATSSRLILYKSNFFATVSVFMIEGDCLYRLGRPEEDTENVSPVGLEKMNRKTGESTWLWRENAGPGSHVTDAWAFKDQICLTAQTKKSSTGRIIRPAILWTLFLFPGKKRAEKTRNLPY